MPKKVTLKEFIEKSNKIHKFKYDYSKFVYLNATIKSTIICPIHGEFEQSSNLHLSGRGCRKCGFVQKFKYSLDELIIKFNKIHKNIYDYSLLPSFIRLSEKIPIICSEHGIFKQLAANHTKGSICPKCSLQLLANNRTFTQEEALNNIIKIHGNRYDYSKFKYTGSRNKCTIICKKHGEFIQTYSNHTDGNNCPKCSNEYVGDILRGDTENFIKKAKLIHFEKYDYSLSLYKGANKKLIIKCKKCNNTFNQLATSHLSGRGCPNCRLLKIKECNSKSPPGWSSKDWEKAALRSENFDSYKVYIVECYSENERFIKVGRTFTTIGQRFKSIPYQFDVLQIFIFNLAKNACKKEIYFKSIFKEFKYKPLKNFNGENECFNYKIINKL